MNAKRAGNARRGLERARPTARAAANPSVLAKPLPKNNASRRACACGGICPRCRDSTHGGIAGSGDRAPAIVHDVLRAPGEHLPEAVRAPFEGRFGQDFSDVRVHTDAPAAASAAAVNALAYTVGNHVVFGAGHGPDASGENGRLLGHELVHVSQWGDSPVPADLRVGPVDDAAELSARAGEIGIIGSKALQRAVTVCEEYRAADPSNASPGPGIAVNVSRSNKTATVNADLEVHGAEADGAKATTIENTISSNWNDAFGDGYSINSTIDVDYRAPGENENGNASQIELVRGMARPSHVAREWLLGSRYMALDLDDTDALSWVAAHEFGHLLGLRDRYSEGFLSKVASLFGGDRSTPADPGYENNIMGVHNGALESRNVQDLIARYTDYTCTRWRTENPI